jgi:hypothetical protein
MSFWHRRFSRCRFGTPQPIAPRCCVPSRVQALSSRSRWCAGKHPATAQPQPLNDDRYAVIWDDSDSEFSFEFGYTVGVGYRITSYSIGPR